MNKVSNIEDNLLQFIAYKLWNKTNTNLSKTVLGKDIKLFTITFSSFDLELFIYFSLLKYETRSIDHKTFTEHQLIVKNITVDDMGIYVAKSKSLSLSAQLSIVDDDKAQGVNYLIID